MGTMYNNNLENIFTQSINTSNFHNTRVFDQMFFVSIKIYNLQMKCIFHETELTIFRNSSQNKFLINKKQINLFSRMLKKYYKYYYDRQNIYTNT